MKKDKEKLEPGAPSSREQNEQTAFDQRRQVWKGNTPMKFGFVLDTPRPSVPLATYLTVKCAWCGRRKFAITDRNNTSVNTNICRECANRLLNAKTLYHA